MGENDFMNKAIAMLASDPQHTKYKCLDQDILNILFLVIVFLLAAIMIAFMASIMS